MKQNKESSAPKAVTGDIVKLLKADHEKVKKLFEEFKDLIEKGNSKSKKEKIVKEICEELTLHALVEESIVYPAARDVIEDQILMDEADVEHAGVKELISQLQSMTPEDSHYDAKVIVLSEYVEHHVKEEEKTILPKLAKSEIDEKELAEEVIHFKEDYQDDGSTKSTQHKKKE
ncbi:hemerythrin domain-containing protein [Nitrosomonas sp.]|uniref:hemerythrin domain-containing protein n=1 Tax=Nitrosomonas sp. TaxID=42353 RepID=UPI0033060C5D